MRISIFGMGYVGSVTSVCLARLGHQITGIEPNAGKVRKLENGLSPIVEPQVQTLLREALDQGRFRATSDAEEALAESDVSLVCVGTPTSSDGRANLDFVRQVTAQVKSAIAHKAEGHELLYRSTMPPGSTAHLVAEYLENEVAEGKVRVFFVPEFLREGSAVHDFENPSLSVVGCGPGASVVGSFAEQLAGGDASILVWEEAEMVKYTCNYWHALKVGFANEIGRLCEARSIDGRNVMETICRDRVLNISAKYMEPGNPFGGSCLPKDVASFRSQAREWGVVAPLLDHVIASNDEHAGFLLRKIQKHTPGKVGVIGLSFKPGTDDLRNSPMIAVIEALLTEGCEVRVFDPHLHAADLVGANEKMALARLPGLEGLLSANLNDVTGWADLLVAFHPCVTAAELVSGLKPETVVLDVNGWVALRELVIRYEGLCW